MKKTVLIDLSFDELDQLTEKASVLITDDYKNYSTDQAEKFIRSTCFLLDTMEGLQFVQYSELASYLYNIFWDYYYEISVDKPLFELVEKHFYSCVELAIKVIAGGATVE